MEDENEDISLPSSLLIKLFDRTGGPRNENKGFVLFFSNTDGAPACVTNFSNTTVKLALDSFIESYIEKQNFDGHDH